MKIILQYVSMYFSVCMLPLFCLVAGNYLIDPGTPWVCSISDLTFTIFCGLWSIVSLTLTNRVLCPSTGGAA